MNTTPLSAGDTAWVLISAALVMLMTPGLAFFYGGLVHRKNMINTLMMSFVALGIIAIEFAVIGYSLSFAPGNAWIGGLDYFALNGVGTAAQEGSTIPHVLFMVFQMMFAVITPALISGAIVGRMKFKAYVLFIAAWGLFVYNPLCHWVWGGGWIGAEGALDFAGGTVVHISAGISALVAALMIGPRKATERHSKPHNVPFVVLGAALLWFGWFGFNGGSALAANGIAANAFVTTNMAASAALFTWVLLESIKTGRPTSVGAAIGAVVGLVTITPAAGFVTPMGAIAMGALGACASFGVIALLEGSGLDDTLDVFACHGIGGISGSILTAFFATTSVNADGGVGIFYGSWGLLGPQLLGTLAAVLFAGVGTAVILFVLNATVGLRPEAGEERGLDIIYHSELAYNDAPGTSLGLLAIQKGYLTDADLRACLYAQEAEKVPRRLGEVLVERGFLTAEILRGLLLEQAVDFPTVSSGSPVVGTAGQAW